MAQSDSGSGVASAIAKPELREATGSMNGIER
jgi:hypothetical protein